MKKTNVVKNNKNFLIDVNKMKSMIQILQGTHTSMQKRKKNVITLDTRKTHFIKPQTTHFK